MQRTLAFRAFSQSRPDIAATQREFGISARSWERMYAGTRAAPAALFPRFALIAWDEGDKSLARYVWKAGMPAELEAQGAPSMLNAGTVERARQWLADQDARELAAIANMVGGRTHA